MAVETGNQPAESSAAWSSGTEDVRSCQTAMAPEKPARQALSPGRSTSEKKRAAAAFSIWRMFATLPLTSSSSATVSGETDRLCRRRAKLLPMRKLILLVPALLAAQQPAKKLDPCALVTKADVQQIVGKTIADPKINKNNAAVCDFAVDGFGNVSFMTQASTPGVTAERTMLELQKRKIQVAEAKGIGDKSFFAAPGYGMTQLNAFKGPHYIIVTLLIPGAGEAAQKAFAEKLMAKALAKL